MGSDDLFKKRREVRKKETVDLSAESKLLSNCDRRRKE